MTLSAPSRGLCEKRGGKPVTESMAAAIDVATKFHISVALLRGREFRQRLSEARRDLVLTLRSKGKTWSEIGRFMDHRDHTTIMDYVSPERQKRRGKPR